MMNLTKPSQMTAKTKRAINDFLDYFEKCFIGSGVATLFIWLLLMMAMASDNKHPGFWPVVGFLCIVFGFFLSILLLGYGVVVGWQAFRSKFRESYEV